MRYLPVSVTAALLAAVLVLTPAQAQEPGTQEAAAIQGVITAQIDAFRSDDGARAWSFATPMLQKQFADPDTFMTMVKGGYKPVYRPKSVVFGRLRDVPGGLVQEVFVVGPDGTDWTALYAVEQQADGSWRISGCRLVEQPRLSA
ncbi:DUF4864 domain-containing protein [Methylobrevis pamukkalensis]|uniref:DUF4864 domain-containing protein n=1 Tax=Methylobrevis pamukkalensis TaxID=1439726 RepID=A0A1E3H4N5_9HYPH|nr:DUF4864 domain-containing protein [Methylobrevis pamukkalensis]ODN71288.1 hypothetical protein A6302_01403 [Methylobrevis pamukkalensis]